MHMKTRLALVLSALTLVAACTAGAADHNESDVMFAQMMIPHHQQAVELADLALSPTSNARPEVIELAQKIPGGQEPEIEQMTALLTKWGQPLDSHAAMGHGSDMEGMLTEQELTDLASLTGSDFDTAWIAAMTFHHRGAISMAVTVKESGVSSEINTLATAIITAQQGEIERMQMLSSTP
jgi:uncharacterized protein (DUF305 family)